MTNEVADIVGDRVLMYAEEESRFRVSANIVLGWKGMLEERKPKLFWENPVRFYARYDQSSL